MQLIRRILFITLVFIMIVGIIINVMGRIYSTIPIQRAIFDNIQIITFNIQRSILESVQGIKKQVLPVTAEFRGREAALSSPCLAVQNYSPADSTAKLSVYNFETGHENTVSTSGKHISGFDVEGANVVWADLRNETRDPMRQEPSGQFTYNGSKQSQPLISGPYVAFLYDTQVNPRYQVVRLPDKLTP